MKSNRIPSKRIPSDRIPTEVARILEWLEARGTRRDRDAMARFGIRSGKVFGVSMETMRPLARRLGRDHTLALALWATGWHEARILASMVAEPACVTPRQMDAWARDFDNWAVCDSVCTQLFDRTPHALTKIDAWSRRRGEFVRRGAFAMMAGLAVHDQARADADFLGFLPIIERTASDDGHVVMKAVNWALRQIGKRNRALNAAAIDVATRLAADDSGAARWAGRDALRELASPAVQAKLAARKMTKPAAGRHTEG